MYGEKGVGGGGEGIKKFWWFLVGGGGGGDVSQKCTFMFLFVWRR